jgi:hypothetical protein
MANGNVYKIDLIYRQMHVYCHFCQTEEVRVGGLCNKSISYLIFLGRSVILPYCSFVQERHVTILFLGRSVIIYVIVGQGRHNLCYCWEGAS